ncbi:MAG: HK97 family phage prohead protease [Mycobacterium sp.]
MLYDTAYRVGGKYGWDETIAQGACDGCLRDDVRYLLNHAGMPMARTVAGTLKLESDKRGLVSDATVDLRQSLAADLTLAVDRGDIDQMSFAFRVKSQMWNDDYTERTIIEFEQLFDTSTVTYPANPATVVALSRNLNDPDAEARRRQFFRHAAAIDLRF